MLQMLQNKGRASVASAKVKGMSEKKRKSWSNKSDQMNSGMEMRFTVKG